MSGMNTSLDAAAAGMRAQAMRLRNLSENIANADTPGYQRKVVPFNLDPATGTVEVGGVRLDQSPVERIYDPGHPLADATGHYDGSNVDLVIEIADAREAQRGYDANLRIFDQARQMTSGLLDLLRR
jgi:flagellar basal-body rod protein FlgC